jgi:hypothetical protein
VEEYLNLKKDIKNIQKEQKFLEINSNFIKDSSINELNINSHIKSFINKTIINNKMNENFEEVLDLIFDDVKTNILDTFSRFSTSKYYINMIKTFSKNLTIHS